LSCLPLSPYHERVKTEVCVNLHLPTLKQSVELRALDSTTDGKQQKNADLNFLKALLFEKKQICLAVNSASSFTDSNLPFILASSYITLYHIEVTKFSRREFLHESLLIENERD
jgi:hypothetical protein